MSAHSDAGAPEPALSRRSVLEAEVRAMADWAAAHGLGPPPPIAETLAPIGPPTTGAWLSRRGRDPEQVHEGDAITGVGSDPELQAPEIDRRFDLLVAHAELTKRVAPALPGTVLRLAEEAAARTRGGRHRLVRVLGPLPVVRRVIAATLVFLVAFVLLTSFQDVRDDTSQLSKTNPPTTEAGR